MDTKWVKDSFDKGKQEILKFARTSRIKIDITSLNKKKEERIRLLGSKVLELIEKGELDAELFEPDHTYIKNIENEIVEKEELLATEESEPEADEFPQQNYTDGDKIDIVQIESQKVLTADSIPMAEGDTEEDKDKHKDYTI